MNDSERLDLFVSRANEMLDTRLIRSESLSAALKIKFDQTAWSLSTASLDEDDLRSFLLTFRRFVQAGEPVFLPTVHNTLWLNLDSDRSRAELAASQAHWKERGRSSGASIVVEGKKLTPEFVMDLWINGHYFHSDTRKRQALIDLGAVGLPLARHGSLDRLVVGTRYVAHLRSVVVRGRSDGLLHV